MPVSRLPARYRAGVSSDRPDSTVGFLSGDWNVERRICDHRGGQVGSFRGTASYRSGAGSASAQQATLTYVESGELRLGSHRGPAGRSLLILDAGDGTADVRFADGREFYRLDLRAGSCTAAHPCRADRYHVTVTRLSADSFAETWRVTGPEKDYELQTTYTRACGANPDSDAGPGDAR
jgi:hypothetical protein